MSTYAEHLMDIATENEKYMDGTTAPVIKAIEQSDVCVAVWEEPSAEGGIGYLTLKGETALRKIVASGMPRNLKIQAVKVSCHEMAIATKTVLGEPTLN